MIKLRRIVDNDEATDELGKQFSGHPQRHEQTQQKRGLYKATPKMKAVARGAESREASQKSDTTRLYNTIELYTRCQNSSWRSKRDLKFAGRRAPKNHDQEAQVGQEKRNPRRKKGRAHEVA